MGPDKALKLKLPLALFFILLLSHSAPGSSHDSSRMSMVENLITKHVWWTEGSRYFNGVDMVMDRGHFYSDKPPIFALYSALTAYPLKFVTSFETPAGRRVFYYVITILSSGLALIGLCLLMRRTMGRVGVPETDRDDLILAAIAGTCILPACLTYVTHTTEAMLLMGTFLALLYYADQSRSRYVYWMGLTIGINIMVHPFVGGMYSILTAAYFLARKKISDLFRFLICVALLGLATLGLNQVLFGTFRPYYTSPEKFLFLVTDGKKVYPSGFMLNPTVQGLTETMVKKRFEEQGYPEFLMERTLQRLRDYKENVQTNLGFAASNWMQWDFIFFNPLVVFSLLLAVRGLWGALRTRRLETLWALAGVGSLYVSTIFQRSMPGGSFGNRYLIASLPPIFVLAATELRRPVARNWFAVLFGFTSVGALIGTTHPWHTPSQAFQLVTMPVYSALALLSVVCAAAPERGWIDRILRSPRPLTKIIFAAVLAAWFVIEGVAYYRTMPDQLRADAPRLLATAGCLTVFIAHRVYTSKKRLKDRSSLSCEGRGITHG